MDSLEPVVGLNVKGVIGLLILDNIHSDLGLTLDFLLLLFFNLILLIFFDLVSEGKRGSDMVWIFLDRSLPKISDHLPHINDIFLL